MEQNWNEIKENETVQKLLKQEELVWMNPGYTTFAEAQKEIVNAFGIGMKDIEDAEERLFRFAPYIEMVFPETQKDNGLIESELIEIPQMKELLNQKYEAGLSGRLLLKKDSHLAIAGSIKARGGIYEILKHAETLAMEQGILKTGDCYDKLAKPENRAFFQQYKIQVGSTGNLGLSIGIISAAIGFRVTVHMSSDARQWKKELLRSKGVEVIEYETDYSAAVIQGRKASDADPMSYFVDDENSRDLFMGYAVAAKRLVNQLNEKQVVVDKEHPLFVYLPCGVGGAPGGITFGLKEIFGDDVHCFFIEPSQAPCMLLGMESGLHNDICVQDIGLSGATHADGLAVGRASGFVGKVMEPILSGIFTIQDPYLYDYMRDCLKAEDVFLEPSACSGFTAPAHFGKYPEIQEYMKENDLLAQKEKMTHIVWATGGSLVPDAIREEYKETYL